jgi:hypothetical protein
MELTVAKKTELEQLKEGIATIAENVLILDAAVSELKTAVAVLQILAARQLRPGRLQDGLKALEALQKQAIESDPHARENKEARELVDRLRQWKKQGGGPLGKS